MFPNTEPANTDQRSYNLKIFLSSLNLIAHILIGAVVGISLLFSFLNGVPLTATPLHIVLCVIGYQLLMSQAILSLAGSNGWSTSLKLVDKRRAHYILQTVGSALAITGSFIKIVDKDIHWNTLHGRFGLVALVFTTVSLVNGLTSLYAYEWRRFLPGNVSKISHICFGTVAYSASCIALCYGFNKSFFRNWATEPLANTVIAFAAIFTFIVIVNPLITFYSKVSRLVKK